jgi:hypothetical protein
VDLAAYATTLSAIHTVLKRLNESGEIRLLPRPSGRHAYLWQAPPKVVAIGEDIAEALRAGGPTRPGAAARTTLKKRTKK